MNLIRYLFHRLLVAEKRSLGSLRYKPDGAPKAAQVDAGAEIERVKAIARRREEAIDALKQQGTWLGIDGVGIRHLRRGAREEEERLKAQRKQGAAVVVNINSRTG